MTHANVKRALRLTLLLPLLLLAACPASLPLSNGSSAQPVIPPLLPSSKMPARPLECLPTCSANEAAQTEREAALLMRLSAPKPAASASTNR